jgi:molybdate transport system ATP-binding protein
VADGLIVEIKKSFPSGAVVAPSFESSTHAGSTLVLFGPSGAGKTTVVRCLAGLERPDTGLIRFGGDTWFDSAEHRCVDPQARGIGYVGQDGALFPHLTVAENIGYGLRPGRERDARVAELIALLNLGDLDRRRPAELSGGQAQRVALARALAPHPRLLLLDEPLGALDAPARRQLRGTLRAIIQQTQVAAVLVTHDRTEAIALADEIVVLIDGRVRQQGRALDVFRHPADFTVAQTVGVESVIRAEVSNVRDGLVDLRVGEARLVAVAQDVELGRADVLACIRAEDVVLQREGSSNGSARNHLRGVITEIERDGAIERVTVDCGFPLIALITAQSREELSLVRGAPIVAVVKATAIHLI